MTYTKSTTTITDANVNSGVAFDIQAKNLSEDIEVFSNAPDTSHSSFTETFANRLTTGRYMGFANPTITIRGVFTIGDATANKVTYDLLHDLVKSSAAKTLVDDMLGTITVLITGITIDKPWTNNGVCDYTMKLVRVKA